MLTAPGVVTSLVAAALSCLLLEPCSAQPADISQTLARLTIDLPKDVVGTTAVRRPLEELRRERCDQDAILHLAKALDDLDYRREAATAQISFSSQCGGYAPALRGAVNLLLKLSDYTAAETVASRSDQARTVQRQRLLPSRGRSRRQPVVQGRHRRLRHGH